MFYQSQYFRVKMVYSVMNKNGHDSEHGMFKRCCSNESSTNSTRIECFKYWDHVKLDGLTVEITRLQQVKLSSIHVNHLQKTEVVELASSCLYLHAAV